MDKKDPDWCRIGKVIPDSGLPVLLSWNKSFVGPRDYTINMLFMQSFDRIHVN